MSNKKLNYNAKDGYTFDFEEKDISCNNKINKNCKHEYKIKLLEKYKFRSLIDYLKYNVVYYYNKYKYQTIILWLAIGGFLTFALSFIFYKNIEGYDVKFQPEIKESNFKTFSNYFIWLYLLVRFLLYYFVLFALINFIIIWVLFKIANSKPIVWLISFIFLVVFASIYKLGLEQIKLKTINLIHFLTGNLLINNIINNSLSIILTCVTLFYVFFEKIIILGRKNKLITIICLISVLYLIYKLLFRIYYTKDLHVKDNYKVDYKTNIKEKFNLELKNIKNKFNQYKNIESNQNIFNYFNNSNQINIEQILGENLYNNKYALINYIENNEISLSPYYIKKIINNKIHKENKKKIFNKIKKLNKIQKYYNLVGKNKDLNSIPKEYKLKSNEIYYFLNYELEKVVNSYELSKNIDDVNIEDEHYLKTRILVDNVKRLNKKYILKDYPNIFITQPNYNFCISCWFFIHEQSPNKSENYSKYTTIYNFSNRPHILYNSLTNTIRIIIKNSNNSDEIFNLPNGIKLQKWNNLLLNFYSNGFVDIFLNNKLTLAKKNILITSNMDIFNTGQDDGISGGICNVVYFSDTLSKFKINLFYNNFKNKNSPVINPLNISQIDNWDWILDLLSD